MTVLKRLFGGFRPASRSRCDGASKGVEGPRSVVVGLGNPGEEYARSRHNAGYRVLDCIAQINTVKFTQRKFKGLIAETTLGGERTVLVKPETYYNLSGECVGAVLGYFKVQPARLIVVHDDLDLEAGRLRLKRGGGDAGNRGVRSIVEALGATDFVRVRVGIGRPPLGAESRDYVLRAMSAQEVRSFAPAVERAAKAVEAIVTEGLERAMARFNQREPA